MRTIDDIRADILKVETGIADRTRYGQLVELELKQLKTELRIAITADIPIDRLEEICNAEREGRCEVLPCKVGEIVYVNSKTLPTFDAEEFDEYGNGPAWVQAKIISIRKNSKGWFIKFSVLLHWKKRVLDYEWGPYDAFYLKERYFSFSASSIGKTVFLTRESAEAALKEVYNDPRD